MMKTMSIAAVLLISAILIYGCCGATYSEAEKKAAEPYVKFYGMEKEISSTMKLKFDKYKESTGSDGTKDVTLTLTATNMGTEEENLGSALFISDEQGRNYEANPFLCSGSVNPGLAKQFDCKFLEIPPTSKIVTLKFGDSIFNKGHYTEIFRFE